MLKLTFGNIVAVWGFALPETLTFAYLRQCRTDSLSNNI